MSRPTFRERLETGEILVADGATGTNHQVRGLSFGDPPEKLLFGNPEQVQALHREFVEAGADIILTNTFGATAIRLAHVGMADDVFQVNRRAAEVARNAVEGSQTLVAGSLGPLGQLLDPLGPLSYEEAVQNYGDQAAALAAGGVDLLVIETQFDLGEGRAAVEGARTRTSLPVVCSFSFDMGKRTMMGVKPDQMARDVASWGADVVGVNCGRSLDDNLAVLEEVIAANTGLPVWIKPNAGLPHLGPNDIAIYDVSPEQMGECAARFAAAGARIIGGCCGTSPDHLREIALSVRRWQPVPI